MGLWINEFMFGVNGHISRKDLTWDDPVNVPGFSFNGFLFTAETLDGADEELLRISLPATNAELRVWTEVMAKVEASGNTGSRTGSAYFSRQGTDDSELVGEQFTDALQGGSYGWPYVIHYTDGADVAVALEAGGGAGVVRWSGVIRWMYRRRA